MLNLKMIVGSTRPGNAADRVLPRTTALVTGHGAFDVEILDLRDWQLPIFTETFATLGDPHNGAAFGPDGAPVGDRARLAAKVMPGDLAWWGTTSCGPSTPRGSAACSGCLASSSSRC